MNVLEQVAEIGRKRQEETERAANLEGPIFGR